MNRFTIISIILHTLIFSTVALSSKSSFKPIPKFEVYKVSIAPMPQPRVYGVPGGEPGLPPTTGGETKKEGNAGNKTQEKSAPKEVSKDKGTAISKEGVPGKATTKTSGLRLGVPNGLPDASPQIYTGSGRGFTYSYYLNILLNKIGQNWQNPYKNKDIVLKSIVYFEIDKNGTISNIRIEEDSGDEVYNESTMRAIALTKKLAPLPQEFSDDYLKVHLEFLTAQ